VAEEKPIQLITPRIVTDEPVEETRGERAYFQFEEYAKTFARIIAAKRTRTPLTIGTHGEWGTGKTTLMRAIEKQLCGGRQQEEDERPPFPNPDEDKSLYRPCRTIWFNAWKYSRQEALFVALIEAILSQMRCDGFIHELYAELARPDQPRMKVAEAVISTLSLRGVSLRQGL
jgi:Cdc6-like AAA superfamily ATPase